MKYTKNIRRKRIKKNKKRSRKYYRGGDRCYGYVDKNRNIIECVDYDGKPYYKDIHGKPYYKDNDGYAPIWGKYYDVNAKANYWYNHLTGEATWINPFRSKEDAGEFTLFQPSH
jgi:hypothetical protein